MRCFHCPAFGTVGRNRKHQLSEQSDAHAHGRTFLESRQWSCCSFSCGCLFAVATLVTYDAPQVKEIPDLQLSIIYEQTLQLTHRLVCCLDVAIVFLIQGVASGLLSDWQSQPYLGMKKGKEGACARKRVAAVPISVSLAIGLQAAGRHVYAHIPRLGNV